MTHKRLLGMIVVLFVVLGLTYATITPPFEASDELWHYPMIRHLADGNPLPVQVFDPDKAGPWKQEASQPPLYYYLGALLTAWIDTSDMERVRWLNPHVDNGILKVDGNINLAIHDPSLDAWQGTLLAVRVVRYFSVLLGATTVYLTYCIGMMVAAQRPEIGLGAAAMNAFLPMFLFISGAVNNDNLAIPLASLAVLLMIRAVKNEATKREWLLLGSVIGLALLTKEGTFALLPLAWGSAFIAQRRHLRRRETKLTSVNRGTYELRLLARAGVESIPNFVLSLIPAALIAGWWYVRNYRLYGDWLGWNAFLAVLGQRSQPASLLQLWSERHGFMMSFWGLFGGVNVPMAMWIYQVLNVLLIMSVFGFVIFLAVDVRQWALAHGTSATGGSGLLSGALDFVESRFALVICFLFSAAVVYGLIQWAATTWSSQGRLVFTALSALCVLMAVGLAGWLPRRHAGYVLGGVGLFLLVIAIAAPFVWIRPAYDPETYLLDVSGSEALVDDSFAFSDTSEAKMRLASYTILPYAREGAFTPGQAVDLVLEWEILSEMSRDWSIFVHLTDPVPDILIAQRDMYPGQGLRPTTLLRTGDRLNTRHYVVIPETAVTPAQLRLTVGLYDFHTGERMVTQSGADATSLTTFRLEAMPSEYPNALSVNFGNELELQGYSVSPRRARPGDTIDLTLYWSALHPLTTNYTFFAQVVDVDTTRWASLDLAPAEGTSAWEELVAQTVTMPLTLSEDTPAQVYPIHIGLYTRGEDGAFTRLQLVTEDGRITQEDFLLLTRIRVD